MKKLIIVLVLLSTGICFGQTLGKLTVEKIMRDTTWIGVSPCNPYWSHDSRNLLFYWNPDHAIADSLYFISLTNKIPAKATSAILQKTVPAINLTYNETYTASAYARDGDLFYLDAKGKERQVTQTTEIESSPQFIKDDTKIVYTRSGNMYAWTIATGTTEQLTNFQRGMAPKELNNTAQEKWLQQEAVKTSVVLQERKAKREATEKALKALAQAKEIKSIYLDDKVLVSVNISPDARFICYRVSKPSAAKTTVVPNYVTETGFTTDIAGRTKVGAPTAVTELLVFDRGKDTAYEVRTNDIAGITDKPDYSKDYPTKDTARKPTPRAVSVFNPIWNNSGSNAIVEVRSSDNKDRWLMLLNPGDGSLKLLDRQRDEAWIGGPGINSLFGRNSNIWLDDNTFWFQSEEAGYSHIYILNIITGKKKAVTSGKYEVQSAQLSKDKNYFYITTNEVHPGEQQFYRLSIKDGKKERITTMTGANKVSISPDEKYLAILYSYSTKPWELFLQENKPGGKLTQLTNKAQTPEFKSYAWIDPEVISFKARDSATVYARLYKPKQSGIVKPAVIFVHGAGYLQNAHKWWSTYFHEYLFHNLLAENGYTVLDIDYRGSAGYGRDWRTGIYRYMGGKDLTDQVDGAKYLVDQLGVDPKRIGIYGGSYGGFITLMAMFKEGDVFTSGAALRSVTDWAHYNHGYTSNILNEPFNDSLSYKRSSPIYYAEGLKGNLLMCHGMVDVNVHFQDIVRLTQRLIELGKNNWELAVYPVEDHGFVEPSSWTDEYKRIFKLFETTLKK
jgi:dipeptidyl aminopeptidase/acylaminoacyl peptidase